MSSKIKVGLMVAVAALGVFHLAQLVSWAQESDGGRGRGREDVAFEEVVERGEGTAATTTEVAVVGRDAANLKHDVLVRRKIIERGEGPVGDPFVLRIRTDVASEIQHAATAVNEAEGDEAKEAAQRQLNALLERYFDDDMKRREEELVRIEERLSKLKALLDLRREKKQEIIDLQTKVALNAAAGLGFYGHDGAGKMPGNFTFGPMPEAPADVVLFRGGYGGQPAQTLQAAPPAVPPPAFSPLPSAPRYAPTRRSGSIPVEGVPAPE